MSKVNEKDEEKLIFRNPRGEKYPFVVADKQFIDDPELSFKAKGIMIYLLSKPDHWKVYPGNLKKHAKDQDTSIRNGLKELEEVGYIKTNKHIDNQGRVNKTKYLIYEKKQNT